MCRLPSPYPSRISLFWERTKHPNADRLKTTGRNHFQFSMTYGSRSGEPCARPSERRQGKIGLFGLVNMRDPVAVRCLSPVERFRFESRSILWAFSHRTASVLTLCSETEPSHLGQPGRIVNIIPGSVRRRCHFLAPMPLQIWVRGKKLGYLRRELMLFWVKVILINPVVSGNTNLG